MKDIQITQHQRFRADLIEFDMEINSNRKSGEKVEYLSDIFDVVDLTIKKNILFITIETGFSLN